MSDPKGSPPREGPDVAAGEKLAGGRRLSRAEIDELITRTVEEELERLEDEEL